MNAEFTIFDFITHPGFVAVVGVAIIGAIWKFGAWYGSVNSDRESFSDFIAKVSGDLREIRDDIKGILQKLPSKAVETNSPVRLTEFGEKISKAVNASGWAKTNAPTLLPRVRDKEEFEIFEICMDYVEEMFDNDSSFQTIVRKGAYDCGTDTIDVMKVHHVELRDAILELLQDRSA